MLLVWQEYVAGKEYLEDDILEKYETSHNAEIFSPEGEIMQASSSLRPNR
jgi:hypothetical protein